MSDQVVQSELPPEGQALQVPQQVSPAPPAVMPPDVEQIDPATRAAINRAIQKACKIGTSTDVPSEAREAGNAVLSLSQALVILDPALVAPQGVPANALHPPIPHIQLQPPPPPPVAPAGPGKTP